MFCLALRFLMGIDDLTQRELNETADRTMKMLQKFAAESAQHAEAARVQMAKESKAGLEVWSVVVVVGCCCSHVPLSIPMNRRSAS